jgi:AcrR family transcriptional regulator
MSIYLVQGMGMMTEQPTKTYVRRQRRIERRKKEILRAAAHVFAEKGYANTTTKEIAAATDIAEGTLYLYFGGKREILLTIVHQTQAAIEAMFREAGELRVRQDVVDLVDHAYEILLSDLPFTRTLFLASWTDEAILRSAVLENLQRISQQVKGYVVQHMEEGGFRPMDAGMVTRMIVAMFIAPMLPILRGIEPLPAPPQRRAWAEMVVDILLDGVRIHQA